MDKYRLDIINQGSVVESRGVDGEETAESYAIAWAESVDTSIATSDGHIPNGCADYRASVVEIFPPDDDDEGSESEADYFDFYLE